MKTLAFSLLLLVALSLPAAAQQTNVVLNDDTTPAASTTYSPSYPPKAAIDGDKRGAAPFGFWNDQTRDAYPDALEIALKREYALTRIEVTTAQDDFVTPIDPTATTTCTLYGLIDFDIQTWNGAAWVTVPNGEVRNNNLCVVSRSFDPIRTNKIRVNVLSAREHFSRIVEVGGFVGQ